VRTGAGSKMASSFRWGCDRRGVDGKNAILIVGLPATGARTAREHFDAALMQPATGSARHNDLYWRSHGVLPLVLAGCGSGGRTAIGSGVCWRYDCATVTGLCAVLPYFVWPIGGPFHRKDPAKPPTIKAAHRR